MTHLSSPALRAALKFSTERHAGQKRKYTFDDYIVHPIAVARILSDIGITDEDMLIAALCHDLVEDTATTLEDIRVEFGDRVADLVFWLTDQSKPEDGNRATRKEIDRRHSSAAPPEAQTIKLADIIDNTATIEQHDPDFARVFRHEKRRLLATMNKGDPKLMEIALQQIEEKAA